MMTAAAGLRRAALERVARFGPVPMERLHIEPFEPSFALERSMWIVHNTKVSLALDRLIAVGKTGCALWLNDDSDPRELFRFMHTEGLVEDLAHTPEQLMELFLDLHTYPFTPKLLRSLNDIDEWEGTDTMWVEARERDRERIASLRDQFYPPEAIPGSPLKLDFWAWSPLGGVVARWHVEFGNDGTGDIIYDEVMDRVGRYFLLI